MDKQIDLSASGFINEAIVNDARPAHILITVPGIRDNGAHWAQILRNVADKQSKFSRQDVEVKPASSGRMGSLPFLLSIGHGRIRKKFSERINSIINQYQENEFSILCHSNGTKIIYDIIRELERKPEYLFLCGSICHRDELENFRYRNRDIINDCGTRDIWPILAETIRPWTFSATGVSGFGNYPIKDRFFPYTHSQYLVEDHFSDWILPVIFTGEIPVKNHEYSKHIVHMPDYIRRLFMILIFALFLWGGPVF